MSSSRALLKFYILSLEGEVSFIIFVVQDNDFHLDWLIQIFIFHFVIQVFSEFHPKILLITVDYLFVIGSDIVSSRSVSCRHLSLSQTIYYNQM